MNDYNIKRALIDNVKIRTFHKNEDGFNTNNHNVYISIPDRIRRQLKLGKYTQHKFRVIIVRRE